MEEEASRIINSYKESLYKSQTIGQSNKSLTGPIVLMFLFSIFLLFLIACAVFFYKENTEHLIIQENHKSSQIIPIPEAEIANKLMPMIEDTAFPDLTKTPTERASLNLVTQPEYNPTKSATPEKTPTNALPVHMEHIPMYSEPRELMIAREENHKLTAFNEKLLEENKRLREQILSQSDQSDQSAKQKVNNGKIVLDETIPQRIETGKPWSLIVD